MEKIKFDVLQSPDKCWVIFSMIINQVPNNVTLPFFIEGYKPTGAAVRFVPAIPCTIFFTHVGVPHTINYPAFASPTPLLRVFTNNYHPQKKIVSIHLFRPRL